MSPAKHQNGNDRQSKTPAAVSCSGSAWRVPSHTKLSILITFLKILVKGKNHYCEPHPDTILELLEKYHKITIKRRWFFQCMRDLEDAGLMRRQRRWRQIDGPEIRSKSSLWWFTIKGAAYLARKSIQGSRELLRAMTAWLHRDDSRRPAPRDLMGLEEACDRAAALQKIGELIRDIGGGPAGGVDPATN